LLIVFDQARPEHVVIFYETRIREQHFRRRERNTLPLGPYVEFTTVDRTRLTISLQRRLARRAPLSLANHRVRLTVAFNNLSDSALNCPAKNN
jgi:hypothetical protein